MRETMKAKAAKSMYAAMPPSKRSLRNLRELLLAQWDGKSPSVRRLEEWSRLHGWQRFVEDYDLERAEEKRKAREERIEEINDLMDQKGIEYFKKSQEYIDFLIENGKLGSQAAVQLYSLSAQLARIATGADKPQQEQQRDVPIQIFIEADTTPPPKLPELPEPANVVEADITLPFVLEEVPEPEPSE